MNDDRQFVAESRIVARRSSGSSPRADGCGRPDAAGLRRSAWCARSAAEQEAARAHVARRPSEIADALKAEHRIVDVERNHRHVRASRRRSPPRSTMTSRPASLMPSCSIWPSLVFLVDTSADRHPAACRAGRPGEDAELAEHAFHAEGARFVRHDRHDTFADVFVAHQRRQHPHERHGGRNFATFRALAAAVRRPTAAESRSGSRLAARAGR